jgi:hypothetical protein|tara:strand:- start:551 stop:784 length:234 start_codon:yes stop_codon:yes gene_type:complete
MNKHKIRFNKRRGQTGWGTKDHVWRVFAPDKHYVFKHLKIEVPCRSEADENGYDQNMICYGFLHINAVSSTATISEV